MLDHQNNNSHLPVMLGEVLQFLHPQAGESYLDLTAGYGGHAAAVLEHTGSAEKSLLVDRDEQAIKELTAKFKESEIKHMDFLAACQELASASRKFDMILADLGISSPHIDNPDRGFSFSRPGPLDMRMDQRQELTASKIVNEWPEEQIAHIIKDYGEEPRARLIAARIVANRPIGDTKQLAEVIASASGRFRRAKIHPATRVFQALRIAVNDELIQIEKSLPLMCELLAPGGRLVVISFHSLEDRLVKRFFKEEAGDRYDSQLQLLTKKPVKPSPSEIALNPRARSALLRAAAKIKNKKKG